MTINLDNYPEALKYEMFKLLIENKEVLPKSDPRFIKAQNILKPFIPESIIDKFEVCVFQKDEKMIIEDYTWNYFIIIVEGICKCTYKEKFLSYKYESDILGSIAMASRFDPQNKASATVTALTDVVIARLKISCEIHSQLRNSSLFMTRVAEDMALIIRSGNLFGTLDTNEKKLATYMLIALQKSGILETHPEFASDSVSLEGKKLIWEPNKGEIINDISWLNDNSNLNRYIGNLEAAGCIKTLSKGRPGRGVSKALYEVRLDKLKQFTNMQNYEILNDKFIINSHIIKSFTVSMYNEIEY